MLSSSGITKYFLRREGSLPCSQEPAAGQYAETDESSPYHPSYLSEIHCNIILDGSIVSKQYF
jgi:hypothetical protein